MDGFAGKNASWEGFDLLVLLVLLLGLLVSLEGGESFLLLFSGCAPLEPDFFLPLGEEGVLSLGSVGFVAGDAVGISGEDFLSEVVGTPAVGADEPRFIFKPKRGEVGSEPGNVPSLMIIVPP